MIHIHSNNNNNINSKTNNQHHHHAAARAASAVKIGKHILAVAKDQEKNVSIYCLCIMIVYITLIYRDYRIKSAHQLCRSNNYVNLDH
jgi:hypothetical protein